MSDKYKMHFFQCFTHEQVKEINKKIKQTLFQKQNPSNASSTATKKGNFFIFQLQPLMELLHPWLYQCQQANRERYEYNIYWDFHLDNLTYNVYEIGDEYGWHIDINHGSTPIDSKLTCLLNLSEEPYEGGEFKLTGIDEKIKFTSGTGIILNSLIAHKVTPVTKGERITLTYWAKGPSWK